MNMPRGDKDLVECVAIKSRCNGNKPRLATQTEQALEPVESKSAACYAGMELLTHRFHGLAERIRDDTNPVPALSLPEADETGAVHIQNLRAKTKAP